MNARRSWGRPLSLLTLTLTLLAVASPAPADDLEIKNATRPEPGVLAAGMPTESQMRALATEGYKTIIDLMAPGEDRGFDEPQVAREAGLRYVAVPVTLASLDQGTIDRFLAAMRQAERPVLVHCASSNRVGSLYYAWLVLEKGLGEQDALAQARAAGLRSAELTEKVQRLVDERQKRTR